MLTLSQEDSKWRPNISLSGGHWVKADNIPCREDSMRRLKICLSRGNIRWRPNITLSQEGGRWKPILGRQQVEAEYFPTSGGN